MAIYNETINVSLPEELGEEIECNVQYHIENDGIGSYEFWGFKGYDAGQDYPEIDSIYPCFEDQYFEETALILEYIDKYYSAFEEEILLALDNIKYDGDI